MPSVRYVRAMSSGGTEAEDSAAVAGAIMVPPGVARDGADDGFGAVEDVTVGLRSPAYLSGAQMGQSVRTQFFQ